MVYLSAQQNVNTMNIHYYGHATFLIETMGKKLLFDPFISGNSLAKDIDLNSIEADYVLASHGHGDHIADVASVAKRCGSTLIANYEIVNHFAKQDIKGHPLNHGGKATFDFGMVKAVNAIHTSSFPDGSYAGNPMGFVIWNDEGCFYFAGDTALTKDMELIPLTCPPLDFSILPIGDNFTMGYDDAALVADLVKSQKNIGCHFDTFGYIEIDHDKAKQAFTAAGKELILMGIGDMIEI